MRRMRVRLLALLLALVLGPGGMAPASRVALAQAREQPDSGPPAGEAAGAEPDASSDAAPARPETPGERTEADDANGADGADEAGDARDAQGADGAGETGDASDVGSPGDADGEDEEASDPDEPRPWADGVPREQQEKARAIYDAANELLHEYLLEEAVEKYREALTHWDHPAIHYNLARALDSLGRPLEADVHLDEALRYGAAAFSRREFVQVVNFKRLLDQKLAEVVIVCEEEAVDIALDGKPIFTGPGRARKRVLPGEHLIVAHKPGQALLTRQLTLQPGRRTTIALETRQRWSSWQPWLVAGAGTLVGITGALLQRRAVVNMYRYRQSFEEECPTGCPDDMYPRLSSLRQRALWQSRFGVTAMITGGTAVLTGTILVVLNQSRSFRIDLNRSTAVSVTPLLGPESAGLALELAF